MSDLYFQEMTSILHEAGICQPTLVLDKQRLDRNIEHLLDVINRGFQYRIVAKSLPSLPLLQYIMRRTGTKRLMSFHLPFLVQVASAIPDADILLGKPMPLSALKRFYQWHQQSGCDFRPDQQLQWLVDSKERLIEYRDVAERQKLNIRVNLEINIGLNRGGFTGHSEFTEALRIIQNSPNLELSGLMGYEAHVTKIPAIAGGPEKAFRQAMQRYEAFVDLVRADYGEDKLRGLCLNAGGSTTYPLYYREGSVNEIATASALVKPTDFDVYTLASHTPAAFVAAPVLKDIKNPALPMAAGISAFLRLCGLSPKRGVFIYGGNWLATPCYPGGCKRSNILGHSSNQELYEVSQQHPIRCEDFMFFRPTQSEALFLQFGNIAVLDQGKIRDFWPVFDYPKDMDTIKNHSEPTRIYR